MSTFTSSTRFFSAVDTPMPTPAGPDTPTYDQRRMDTGASVASGVLLVVTGITGAWQTPLLTGVDGLEYLIILDGDPNAIGQTVGGGRFAHGQVSGTVEERVRVDIPAILVDTGTTLPSEHALLETEADAATRATADIAEHDATQATLVIINADTDDIQSRLPVALVGGAMDSDVSNMQTDTVDANALAADAVAEIQAGLATATTITALQVTADRIEGLVGHNQALTVDTKNANGDMLTGTLRHYDTQANAILDDGATGLLDTYDIVATYDGTFKLDSYTQTRVGS